MSAFNDHSRRLARMRSAKRGKDSLGGLLAIVAFPVVAIFWIAKAIFWILFWPFLLFRKK